MRNTFFCDSEEPIPESLVNLMILMMKIEDNWTAFTEFLTVVLPILRREEQKKRKARIVIPDYP